MSLAFSFQQAVRLAVHNKNSDRTINPVRWAETYRVSVEDVRIAFEIAESEASLAPSNAYEAQDD